MTSPGLGKKPESTSGVYDDVFGKGSAYGQDLTPDSVRKLLMPAKNPLTAAFDKVGSFFESLVRDIAYAIVGKYQGSNSYLLEVQDGQLSLSDRLDLLSPLLDYCSVSTSPGKGDAMNGKGRMPFDYPIGPYRGVTPVDNMLRLDKAGLWDIRSMVMASWKWTDEGVTASVRVLREDKSVYSEQSAYFSAATSQTLTIVTSVVVPDPGYFVEVFVEAPPSRGWYKGPKWSRLTVQRISSGQSGGTGAETSATPDAAGPGAVPED